MTSKGCVAYLNNAESTSANDNVDIEIGEAITVDFSKSKSTPSKAPAKRKTVNQSVVQLVA